MVDIRQEGRSQRSAPQRRHTAHLRWCSHCTPKKPSGLDWRGEKMHPPPGESVLAKHLVAWAGWTWEEHKTQAQPSLCLCGVPKNLNLSSLDLGSACNPGPTLDSCPAEQPEPEQCRLGKPTHHERGQTKCSETLRALPTLTSGICLRCSSLPTARLSKWA